MRKRLRVNLLLKADKFSEQHKNPVLKLEVEKGSERKMDAIKGIYNVSPYNQF